MSLLCSFCHKEITEAPIAAIHLGCAPKVMELAATDSQQLKPKMPGFSVVYNEAFGGVNSVPCSQQEFELSAKIYSIIARHIGR